MPEDLEPSETNATPVSRDKSPAVESCAPVANGQPDQAQITQIHHWITEFNHNPDAALRRRWIVSFFVIFGILAMGCLALGWIRAGFTLAIFTMLSGGCYFLVHGISLGSEVLQRMARLLRVSRIGERVALALGILLMLGVLGILGVLDMLLGLVLLGLVPALALYLMLDRRVADKREEVLEHLRQILAQWHRPGVNNHEARKLVCVHGGDNWEPCFEAIFGHTHVLEARNAWRSGQVGRTPGHRLPGRDMILLWLGERIESRLITPDPGAAHESPQHQFGNPPPRRASEVEKTKNSANGTVTPPRRVSEPRIIGPRTVTRIWRRLVRALHFGPATFLLGRPLRLLLGIGLLAMCVLWARQNQVVPVSDLFDLASQFQNVIADLYTDAKSARTVPDTETDRRAPNPLTIAPLPPSLTNWACGYGSGLAGLIPVFSLLFGTVLIVLGAYAAAAAALAAENGWISPLGDLDPTATAIIMGGATFAVGVLLHAAACLLQRLLPSGRLSERQIHLINARGQVLHRAPRFHGPRGGAAVQLLRQVLIAALRDRASDVHFEPDASGGGQIRMRVDGLLVDVTTAGCDVFAKVLNLVKVLCDLDITQHRVVQEGHFRTRTRKSEVDYRISYAPAVHGQKLVVRVLDSTHVPQRCADLLMPLWMSDAVWQLSQQSAGMLLTCGPTGSGKTTTLYAVLRDIDVMQRNVITIEEPVEYQIAGVTQLPVQSKTDGSFGSLLRSALRQDPDVIMVGEIRDADTANTAMQAAMTGHLVLSTVHANDTAGALMRLLDLGVAPQLMASSVNLILTQRLIRTLCPRCKHARSATVDERNALEAAGTDAPEIFEPMGCSHCLHTGYRGRRALFELLAINDAVRRVILDTPTAQSLRQAGLHDNAVLLPQAGWQAVAEGSTAVEELQRALE